MDSKSRYGCLAALLFVGLIRPAAAQQSQPSYPCDATVIGDDVYVRSGAGSNFYPTTKLHSGDTVRVLGEQFGWVRVAPPTGSFSYVDMSMVEKTGPKEGKVKVENLRVYAGSNLSARKREMQTVLAKDATVEILGEADGFYKIAPPANAVLWISGQFVKRAGESTPLVKTPVKMAAGTPSTRPATAARTTPHAAPTPPRAVAAAPRGRSVPSTQPGEKITVRAGSAAPERWAPFLKGGAPSEQLAAAETDLRALLAKKDFNRAQLDDLRKRFAAVAAQTDDSVAALIAGSRVKQLQDRIDILASREQLAAERSDLDVQRAQLGEERQRILNRTAVFASQPDVTFRGELRTSALFAPSMGRFRLADPADTQTTVAYIDVPTELRETAMQLLGQVVTVRAASQVFNQNLRVPVAVASVMTPAAPTVKAATSQPAATQSGVADRPSDADAKAKEKGDPLKEPSGH